MLRELHKRWIVSRLASIRVKERAANAAERRLRQTGDAWLLVEAAARGDELRAEEQRLGRKLASLHAKRPADHALVFGLVCGLVTLSAVANLVMSMASRFEPAPRLPPVCSQVNGPGR